MYGLGDGAKNAQPSIFHIEGDPDHPVNRGTLCPKGAGLIDFIHSESRLKYPEYRAPGSDQWQRMSWDDALDRIAKLMKQDRDANFVAKTPDGLTVNRWLTTGMLAASASSNEVGYLTAQGCALTRDCWHSIIRRVCDTARRWQVLPRRLAVER